MDKMTETLLRAFVPEEILQDLDVEDLKLEFGVYRICMVEKDDDAHRPNHAGKEYVHNGYMNPVELQTFSIAGDETFLYLKRRRWQERGGGGSRTNECNYAYEGTKCTGKFGAFLKGAYRRQGYKHR